MSSEKSNSTERDAPGSNLGPARNPLLVVAVTIGLLAALVVASRPARPAFVPAPLRALAAACPKSPAEFTPTSLTEIPSLNLEPWPAAERNRVLLRLNMEPCDCGCAMSLASCRAYYPSCETSNAEGAKIARDEKGSPNASRH